MLWTYADVKLADEALSPVVSDPGEAAAALNEQTVPGPIVSVSVAAIHGALMLAPTGDWLRISALAATAHSVGWPANPTEQDQAVSAAQLALELAASKVTVIEPAKWMPFLLFLSGLRQAGAISSDAFEEISAMATPSPTIPRWNPPLDAGIVQTARAQP